MIADLLNRDVVLGHLADVRTFVASEIARGREDDLGLAEKQRLIDELEAAERRERTQSSGQHGHDAPPAARARAGRSLDEASYFSRDPIVSLLQSVLDEYYAQPEHAHLVVTTPAARAGEPLDVAVTDRALAPLPPPDGGAQARVFEKFSITDIRWVRSKLAEGITMLRGRHPFNTRPAAPAALADRARLVLAGDWATGLPRAQKVARQMRHAVEEALAGGVPVHVIHLGDVYYSGWRHEYLRRFLPYWPVRPEEADRVGSWCLNGNHDMYAGGYGYYQVALGDPRFARQQGSSFFSLVNRHWKILGLDTAWTDHGLEDPQADWLAAELADAGTRRTMLMSHHQLFSVYEDAAQDLAAKVVPVLARTPVTAWFWGHEHRCMVYAPHQHVDHARCIGHAGVPVYMWHDERDPYPPPGTYEYRRFLQDGFERWALFGLAVLDFDGPRLHVRYIDENGFTHYSEAI